LQKESHVKVVVRPRAGKTEISGLIGGVLRISVREAPEDGRANDAVCALLAKELGISKQSVRVVSGHSARQKLLAVLGVSEEAIARVMDKAETGNRKN
jgi:uncharacterized protein